MAVCVPRKTSGSETSWKSNHAQSPKMLAKAARDHNVAGFKEYTERQAMVRKGALEVKSRRYDV